MTSVAGNAPPQLIVGLGLTVVDFLSVVDEYPQVDTKQDVGESMIQVGGPVPTALAQLTALGRRCQLISRWGDDVLGDVIEADLRRNGIVFAPTCSQSGSASGHSQVWIERVTGKRTSVTSRPDAGPVRLGDADRESLQRAMALHLDGSFGDVALQAAETVKSAGGRVMLDTGSPKPGIEELLRVADVVNAPRRFIEEFCGVSDLLVGARTILERGAKLVTVTDGEAGAVMGTEAGTWHVSALPLPRVIDTNGAGDVFSAGIIHGVLCGWAAERTLRFASALAGMKCAALGNRATPRAEQPAQLAADKLVVVDLCR